MIKESTMEKTVLPAGWELTALGKVCEVIAGQSPESKFYNTNEEGLAFYQGKKDFLDKYIGQPTKWTTKITKEAIKNDILMSVRAPVGPVNFSIQKCCIGRGLAAIRASEKIDKEYLYNFLVKFENEIEGNEGAVFNSINKSQIGAIPIPLPPLSQQKQIVATLDKAFAAIDTAIANAEQNLLNAKELFESYLQNVFENKGDDWEEKTLGEVVNIKTGKLNSNAMVENGEYPFFTCSKKIFSINEYAFDCKAVLLAGNNASGDFNVKYYEGKFNAYQRTYVITINSENELLYSYLEHKLLFHLSVFKKLSLGANTKFLKLGMIKGVKIILPPIEQQQEIIKKLDAISIETKKLEAIYKQKLADLEELKKSVLQKAFSGQLTSTN